MLQSRASMKRELAMFLPRASSVRIAGRVMSLVLSLGIFPGCVILSLPDLDISCVAVVTFQTCLLYPRQTKRAAMPHVIHSPSDKPATQDTAKQTTDTRPAHPLSVCCEMKVRTLAR